MALDDVYTLSLANFADHVPNPTGNCPLQNFLPVLRDPDQVEVYRENCMRSMPIVAAHARKLKQTPLMLPPKGGGFNPPNGRQ